jgi:hypothetical protein
MRHYNNNPTDRSALPSFRISNSMRLSRNADRYVTLPLYRFYQLFCGIQFREYLRIWHESL